MGNRYIRSEVLNFWELTDEQQKVAISDMGQDEAEQTSYVNNPTHTDEVLPLNMFERSNGKIWDGIYGQSAFSAYFIKLSKCGTGAVVADRWF